MRPHQVCGTPLPFSPTTASSSFSLVFGCLQLNVGCLQLDHILGLIPDPWTHTNTAAIQCPPARIRDRGVSWLAGVGLIGSDAYCKCERQARGCTELDHKAGGEAARTQQPPERLFASRTEQQPGHFAEMLQPIARTQTNTARTEVTSVTGAAPIQTE